MKTKIKLLVTTLLAIMFFTTSCKKHDKIDPKPVTPGSKSASKELTAFSFAGLTPAITGTIDATARTIAVTVPSGTDLTKLVPTITVSAKATVSPATGIAQDFSKEVSYTVTAEDATTQVYKVTVTKEQISGSVSSDQVIYYFSRELKTDNTTGKLSILKSIVAIDALTGKNVGSFNLGTEIPNYNSPYISTFLPGTSGDGKDSGPGLYDNGLLYTFQTKKVNALDAKSGNIKWSAALEDYSSSGGEPTVDNGILFVGGFFGKHVYALDAATGNQKWVFSYTESINTFTASNGILYVGYGDINYSGGLLAVDIATGKEKWNIKTLGVSSNPAVVNGIVYYGDGKQKVYAVDASTGAKKWEYATGGIVSTSPTVSDGILYIGSEDRKVYALDASTGIKKWAFSADGKYRFQLIADDRYLYLASYVNSKYTMYALDKKTGEKKWESIASGDASPIIANGILYFGLEAFDSGTGTNKNWGLKDLKNPCIVIKGKYYPNTNSGMIQ